jgi:cell fate (sporulation/competence/biofilm development) regulator YmcA (YheA/YmcA/DUF963 family)
MKELHRATLRMAEEGISTAIDMLDDLQWRLDLVNLAPKQAEEIREICRKLDKIADELDRGPIIPEYMERRDCV